MDLRLHRPLDLTGFDVEVVERFLDRGDFGTELEWIVYQAKVYYEGLGDSREAIRILEEGQERYPDSPDLLFCLAECLSRQGSSLERALAYCEKGLGIEGGSDYGHTIRARIQLARGNPFQSYISAMDALKINSRNFEAGIYLGMTGFAIAAGERNIEEMEYSLDNLRKTLGLNPSYERLVRIIEEDEAYLRKVKGGAGDG